MSARRRLATFATLALLALPAVASADQTPYEVLGDSAPNVFNISMTVNNTIQICQDSFCGEEDATVFNTINVYGNGGDDILIVDQDSFITNNNGGITVNFDGGTGNNHIQICPQGCLAANVESTVYLPGASPGAGTVDQTSGTQSFHFTFVNVTNIFDGSGGSLATAGTAGADTITLAPGSSGNTAIVYVGQLVPYEFTGKPTVTLDGHEGADVIESTLTTTPGGLTGDCGTGEPICLAGGSSDGDRLIVHGVPGTTEHVTLDHQGPNALGQELGSITGIGSAPGISYSDVEDIRAVLQSGRDGDRLVLDGSDGPDHFELTPSTSPREVAIDGVIGGGSPGTSGLPHTVLAATDTTGPTWLEVHGGEGTDDVVVQGTSRDDGFAVKPDEIQHSVDGATAFGYALTDVERQSVSGAGGTDQLSARGLTTPTTWSGGDGADTLTLQGTGTSGVTERLGEHTTLQDGFAAITDSGVETLALDAGGSSVSLSGGDGADAVRFAPASASSGTVTSDGDDRSLRLSGVSGVLRLDTLGGADSVVLRGTSAAEDITLTRDGSGGTLTGAVGALLPVRLASTVEALRAEGSSGDDRFLIAGSGGPQSLTVDGGDDPSSDTLIATQSIKNAAVSYGADPATGTLAAAAPNVGFAGIERVQVEGDGTGGLTVSGSPDPDTLTQSGNTISAGLGALVTFSRFPSVALDAGAGEDRLVVSPRTASQVTGISVAGGGSDDDQLTVNGLDVGETLNYAPTAVDAGRVTAGSGAPVTFTGMEGLAVDGRNSGSAADNLTVDTRGLHGTQVLAPGAGFDTGSVSFREATGTAPTAAPLAFARLGDGALTFDDATRDDRLVYRGSTASDVFNLGGDGIVRLNGQIPVKTPGVHTLVLDGQDGAETFNVPAATPFPGTGGGSGLVLDGGNPDSGDTVNLAAGGVPVVTDLAASTIAAGSSLITLANVERTNLDAAAKLTATGGGGPDVVRYTPTGTQAGTLTRDGDTNELRFTNVAGDIVADTAGGADQVVVNGRSTADSNRVVRGAPTTVQVEDLAALRLPDTVESVKLQAGDGNDTTTVSGSGGPASLTVVGGLPAGAGDKLTLQSANATVTYDSTPTAGILDTPGGQVGFAEIEGLDLAGDGTGALNVNGGPGANTISVGGADAPQIAIDSGGVLGYSGFPALTVDGKGGDDKIDVSYAQIGALNALDVKGGGGLGDQLSISDVAGSPRSMTVRPSASDAGTFSLGAPPAQIGFTSTEGLVIDGMGGPDRLTLETPTGGQSVKLTPGATDDAGTLQLAALVPVRFQRLGDGSVRLADAGGGRSDTLTYEGTAATDAFDVAGDPNEIRMNTRVPVLPDSVAHLVLNGYDGDDRFDLTGPLPFADTRTDASGPDRADTLTVDGPSGPVTTDLGAGTLQGYGGTVSMPGVEKLTTSLGGRTLTELGTSRDDALCYDAMAPRDGQAYVVANPGAGSASTSCVVGTGILHTFLDVGRLVLDPAAGADQVIVNGTAAADLLTLDLTNPTALVTVHPDKANPSAYRLPAEVSVASTESLAIAADNGADTIDATVHNGPAPTVFVDGEDPNVKDKSDLLNVRDPSRSTTYRNQTGSTFSGAVFASWKNAFTQRIDYVRVEKVATYK